MGLRAYAQRRKGADPYIFRDGYLMGHVLQRPEDFFKGDAASCSGRPLIINRNKVFGGVFFLKAVHDACFRADDESFSRTSRTKRIIPPVLRTASATALASGGTRDEPGQCARMLFFQVQDIFRQYFHVGGTIAWPEKHMTAGFSATPLSEVLVWNKDNLAFP